jgi:hypothetical protein
MEYLKGAYGINSSFAKGLKVAAISYDGSDASPLCPVFASCCELESEFEVDGPTTQEASRMRDNMSLRFLASSSLKMGRSSAFVRQQKTKTDLDS